MNLVSELAPLQHEDDELFVEYTGVNAELFLHHVFPAAVSAFASKAPMTAAAEACGITATGMPGPPICMHAPGPPQHGFMLLPAAPPQRLMLLPAPAHETPLMPHELHWVIAQLPHLVMAAEPS